MTNRHCLGYHEIVQHFGKEPIKCMETMGQQMTFAENSCFLTFKLGDKNDTIF